MNIAIIGTGAVGASIAFALTIKHLGGILTLIDVQKEKEKGEVMDLSHGLSFVETSHIKRGSFKDAAQADVIVMTAGVPQKPGETRFDLVQKNAAILKSIFKQIGKIQKDAVIIVVANPVDILTYIAQEISGLPKNQVFGSGTSLDTSRLRWFLSQRFKVNPSSVHAYVLGEHGDSEFAALSMATIGGVPLKYFPEYDSKKLKEIEIKTKRAAYEIIKRKGATYYAIALAVAEIIEAIIFDQNKVMAVSVRLSNYQCNEKTKISGVCLGVPAVIGASGIKKAIRVHLNASETKKMKASEKILKSYLRKVC